MNVNKVLTKEYENKTLGQSGKNKANSNPIKANFKKAAMLATTFLTKDYENISNCPLAENKPNQSQFQTAPLLINRMNRICCVCSFSVSFDSAKMALYTDNWNLKKGGKKKLNLLKCKRLNSLSLLRPLTGTLFAYSNFQNFLYTDEKQ